MIKIGINENLYLEKVGFDDNNQFNIDISEKQEGGLVEALNSSSDNSVSTESTRSFKLFKLSTLTYDGNTKLTPEQITNNIAQIKDPLNHILTNYLPTDQIKWDIWKDTNVTSTNLREKLEDQNILDTVYTNIGSQFEKMITPFLNNKEILFRFIFLRQSAAKSFPVFRNRYLDSNPFMEPMNITKENSKLKFTTWERNNKKDVDGIITPDVPEDQTDAAADLLGKN